MPAKKTVKKRPVIDKKSRPAPSKKASAKTAGVSMDINKSLGELKLKDLLQIIDSHLSQALAGVGGLTTGAAHVNSGPTGHENVPGHADFTKAGIARAGITPVPEYYKPEATKPEWYKPEAIKPEAIKPEWYKPESMKPETSKPAGTAAHVNSGPTGHRNVPGHADFTAGAHVNSGPTGHKNVPGHADFTKVETPEALVGTPITVVLGDGRRITIPASGPRAMTIGDIQILRG